MRKGIFVLFQVVVCALMFSCKPQIPSKYLQPDEMEDILYQGCKARGIPFGPDEMAAQEAAE